MGEGQRADRERYEASLARLHEIYQGISDTVDQVSKWRCPYKSAQGRCTANFGCRNQQRTDGTDALPICGGSDRLDYRGAWEA